METLELLQGDEWLGHPAHPAFVALPIGIWTYSFLMDNVATISGNDCAQEAADMGVTVGLVGAALSAATGIGEFTRVSKDDKAQDTVLLHAALNISAVGVYAINAIIRNGRRSAGKPGGFFPKLLSLIGMGIISYSGWLGGGLAYKFGTGVQVEGGTGQREEQTKIEGRKRTVRRDQREAARI